MSTSPTSRLPILAVDIDGVISLFGFEGSPEQAPCRFQLFDGMAHCISLAAGDRLRRLLPSYELVWASGWGERANDHLPAMLGLPPLPYLSFGRDARFGSSHWKLGPIEAYAGDRPLAWIDDSLEPACYEWAERRAAPTLLVPTEPDHGLQDPHVEALLAWTRDGYTR